MSKYLRFRRNLRKSGVFIEIVPLSDFRTRLFPFPFPFAAAISGVALDYTRPPCVLSHARPRGGFSRTKEKSNKRAKANFAKIILIYRNHSRLRFSHIYISRIFFHMCGETVLKIRNGQEPKNERRKSVNRWYHSLFRLFRPCQIFAFCRKVRYNYYRKKKGNRKNIAPKY
jgi:hypothetical protein